MQGPRIETPLGIVLLEASVDGHQASSEEPTRSFRLPHEARLLCWHRDDFDLELLVCRPVFRLPAGMRVEDCWAGMWRLQAHRDLSSSLFLAVWETGYRWSEGGADSGEGLYAKTWEDERFEVSVGTEDEAWLARRAHRGEELPRHWESYFEQRFWDHPSHWEYNPTGLPVPFPLLEKSALCQAHFVVAWSQQGEEEIGPWFAVDRPPVEILKGAACR